MIAPLCTAFLAQLRPHDGIARRRFAEPLHQTPDIETCPVHYQRQSPPPVQLCDDLARMLTEETGIVWLIRIDEINEMVGDALPRGNRRLVRPHIHPAIELA